MSEPKKQHYVPQTYLKRFSFFDKSSKRIFVLLKNENKLFCTNIRNAGAERHFYTVKHNDGQYIWENIYADKIEPLLSDILSRIVLKCDNALIQNKSSVLTNKMKLQLSLSIIYQFLRGKQSRDFQKNVYSKIAPSIVQDIRDSIVQFDESKEKIMQDFLEGNDYFIDVSFKSTFDMKRLEKYVDIIMRKIFIVYRIIGKSEFITSDNPVMFMNAVSSNVAPFTNGLIDRRTIIYFPISPKLLLAIYNPNIYFGLLAEDDRKIVFLDSLKEQSFIRNQNIKQYEQCFNQVYAKNIEDLERIK